ncbi:unnamed protein product, partial [Rotaria socialis]
KNIQHSAKSFVRHNERIRLRRQTNIYPDFVRQDGVDYVGNDIPPFPVEAADYASCVLTRARLINLERDRA